MKYADKVVTLVTSNAKEFYLADFYEVWHDLDEDEAAAQETTIGEENPYAEMRECTLITSTYLYRDQVVGILGVVGPRRLPYPDVIAVVNETARHVTEALSRVRQDLYLPS
ncbi:MAG: hypothetical protein AAB387_04925 [candidate division NC10 bacterium]